MAVQRSKFVSVIIDKIPAPEGAGVDLGRSEEVLYLKSVTEGQTTMHFIERFSTEHPYDYQHVYKLVVKETLEEYMSQERGDIWCKTVRFFVTWMHCFRIQPCLFFELVWSVCKDILHFKGYSH